MAEILFVVLLAGGMFGSGIYVGIRSGYWHLFAVFAFFFGCFGLVELHAIKTTNMSVSQQMWEFGANNPVGFWVVMGALLVSWLALLYHFAQKKIGGKR